MYKFKIGKLVRDKIAQRMIADEKADYRVLNEVDFIKELKKKIFEEAKELVSVRDKEPIIKELVDIQEIIDALIRALKFSKKELRERQREEKRKSGAFNKRLFIESIELEDKHEWLKHYLAHPGKYPQIKK